MYRSIVIFAALIGLIAVGSCKKTGKCNAVILVQDTLGLPVAGAKVVLRQDSVINPTTGVRADVYQEQVSVTSGEAFFEFPLEAVLNVEVTKGNRYVKDYVKLEQSETVRKSVVLK